jgi:predicted RNA-binding Zn ribbon-like protein
MDARSGSQHDLAQVSDASRPPPIILADHPALDLVNTRAFPGGKEVEWLADGRDLIAWLTAANLGEPAVLEAAASDIGVRRMDAVAAEARALREWLRAFVEKHAGRPLPRSAAGELGPLNKLLSEDTAFRSIEAVRTARSAADTVSGSLVWRRHRRDLPADAALLLPVADAIGDLLTAEDFTLVHQCEGTGCSLVFLDRTKNHARRWCSIAWCGNRAKAAAHRARLRGHRQ